MGCEDGLPKGCPYTSIQSAINAASPGATISIGPGSYHENLIVDKSADVHGSGDTVIYPAASNPVCAGGSLCGGTASNIILVAGRTRDDHQS